MLRVVIEVWPGGDGSRAYRLGEVKISNQSLLADVSDYRVECAVTERPGVSRIGEFTLRGHYRKNGWIVLVGRAFARLIGEGA